MDLFISPKDSLVYRILFMFQNNWERWAERNG